MQDVFVAVVVGIVEGLTEFLPVSSTGHMILVEDWLGFHGEAASVFAVFIQLGAILSVFFLYREKYRRLMNLAHGSANLPDCLSGILRRESFRWDWLVFWLTVSLNAIYFLPSP